MKKGSSPASPSPIKRGEGNWERENLKDLYSSFRNKEFHFFVVKGQIFSINAVSRLGCQKEDQFCRLIRRLKNTFLFESLKHIGTNRFCPGLSDILLHSGIHDAGMNDIDLDIAVFEFAGQLFGKMDKS